MKIDGDIFHLIRDHQNEKMANPEEKLEFGQPTLYFFIQSDLSFSTSMV